MAFNQLDHYYFVQVSTFSEVFVRNFASLNGTRFLTFWVMPARTRDNLVNIKADSQTILTMQEQARTSQDNQTSKRSHHSCSKTEMKGRTIAAGILRTIVRPPATWEIPLQHTELQTPVKHDLVLSQA
jgi:hypothetical protein